MFPEQKKKIIMKYVIRSDTVCECAHVHTCVNVYMCEYNIIMYIYVCVYVCVCVCACVCVCVCVYMCVCCMKRLNKSHVQHLLSIL